MSRLVSLCRAAAALEYISEKHAVVQTISAYRTLSTIDNHFLKPLLDMAQRDCGGAMPAAGARIHPRIMQLATPTGRLAMDEPNLQSIPKLKTVSIGLGGGDSTPFTAAVRKGFVARPGCVLLSADYSQLEVRIIAHFSQDATLLAALNSGKDVFIQVRWSHSHSHSHLNSLLPLAKREAKRESLFVSFALSTREDKHNA